MAAMPMGRYDPLSAQEGLHVGVSAWRRIADESMPPRVKSVANYQNSRLALLDAKALTWTPTGQGKRDINDEEGWTLLPNGKVLTVDAYVFSFDPLGMGSEIYDPSTGAWTSADSTSQSSERGYTWPTLVNTRAKPRWSATRRSRSGSRHSRRRAPRRAARPRPRPRRSASICGCPAARRCG